MFKKFKTATLIWLFSASFLSNSTLWAKTFAQVDQEYGTNPVSLANQQFIKNILHEVGMDNFTIDVRRMNDNAIQENGYMNLFMFVKSALHGILFISEQWFDQLSLDEKRFLVGHELGHLFHGHSSTTQEKGETIISKIVNYLTFAESKSACSHMTELKKIGFSPLKDILNKTLERNEEYEADRFAIERLNCKKGALEVCQRWQKSAAATAPEHAHDSSCGCFGIHPKMSQRIDYLNRLTTA